MKKEKISEAMGNISSRHIEEAAEFKAEKKPLQNKMSWAKWASLAACFCLIIVATVAVIPMLNNGNGDGGAIVDNVLPTDIDKIIWNSYIGSTGNTGVGYLEWNGFSVDTPLYDALQNHHNEFIAVVMAKANGQPIEANEYNEILDKSLNRDYKHNTLYLFITKEQFLSWNLQNKSDYVFYLAERSTYEK